MQPIKPTRTVTLVPYLFLMLAALPCVSHADLLEVSIEGKVLLTEHDLEGAEASVPEQKSRSQVSVKLDAPSARAFAKFTASNPGKKLSIKLKGSRVSLAPIRDTIESERLTLPGYYSAKEAKRLAEDLNLIVREEGLISANGQTLFQYYGGNYGHTFRIVKMPAKDFDSFPEVLDSRAISVKKDQRFVYNSDATCTYDGDPAFAVIQKLDLKQKKTFHPVSAWIVEVVKNKIIFPATAKVECTSHLAE